MKRKAPAAIGAILALTGCAAGSAKPVATVTVTAPATTRSAATPPPTTVHPLGEWVTVGNVRTRALEARQEDSSQYDRTPDRAVQVEACVDSGSYQFGWRDFVGADADKGQYPAASSTYGDYPRPMFPFANQQATDAGGCVKGWVLFPTNEDTQLAYIAWGSSAGGAAVWSVA